MKIYNFDDVKNLEVSNKAKEIIELGEKANSDTNFDYKSLMDAVDEFEFMLPIEESEDNIVFPIVMFNDSTNSNDEYIPLFTCFGEMMIMLHKSGLINQYSKIGLVKLVDIMNSGISDRYKGAVIDSYGVSVFVTKPLI